VITSIIFPNKIKKVLDNPLTNQNQTFIISISVKELKRKEKCTMTNRDFYNAVINANINEEMTQFATDAIAKLDARNAKRANTESKTQIANKPIIEAISRVLTDEPMLA
jgi:hypothetical protein